MCIIYMAFCGLFYTSYAQVGINTTTPRKALDIAGDMKISNTIDIDAIETLDDADVPTFINQDTDDSLKTFDVSNPTGVALGYIQEYVITNPEGDWILNFDTRISSLDYDVTIISAYFNKELVITYSGPSDNFSLPYTFVYSSGNTWRIIADFPSASPRYSSPAGVWTINTLIFSKDLSKQLGNIENSMSGSSTGAAATPIID